MLSCSLLALRRFGSSKRSFLPVVTRSHAASYQLYGQIFRWQPNFCTALGDMSLCTVSVGDRAYNTTREMDAGCFQTNPALRINLYQGLPKIVNIFFFKWAYGSDDRLAGSISMLHYITCFLKSEDPRDQKMPDRCCRQHSSAARRTFSASHSRRLYKGLLMKSSESLQSYS